MNRTLFLFLAFCFSETLSAQQTLPPKEHLLFQKLDATIQAESRNLDGVLGAYVLDLNTNNSIALNADETFPTASTIKIAILAELFHQAQQGKLNLNDPTSSNRKISSVAAASLPLSLQAQQSSPSATSPLS